MDTRLRRQTVDGALSCLVLVKEGDGPLHEGFEKLLPQAEGDALDRCFDQVEPAERGRTSRGSPGAGQSELSGASLMLGCTCCWKLCFCRVSGAKPLDLGLRHPDRNCMRHHETTRFDLRDKKKQEVGTGD